MAGRYEFYGGVMWMENISDTETLVVVGIGFNFKMGFLEPIWTH